MAAGAPRPCDAAVPEVYEPAMTVPTIPFPLLMLVFFAMLVLLLAGAMLLAPGAPTSNGHEQDPEARCACPNWRMEPARRLDADPRPPARPGKTPDRPVLTVALAQSAARIGDHRPLCSISMQNTGSADLERCLVQMEQFSGKLPDQMPMPLVLRTEGQIVSRDSGRFTLGPEQIKRVPLLFRSPPRTNEMYFFDENGHAYQYPPGLYRAGPIQHGARRLWRPDARQGARAGRHQRARQGPYRAEDRPRDYKLQAA